MCHLIGRALLGADVCSDGADSYAGGVSVAFYRQSANKWRGCPRYMLRMFIGRQLWSAAPGAQKQEREEPIDRQGAVPTDITVLRHVAMY